MEQNKVIPTPVKTNWVDQKKKLKEQFPTLTDADLNFEEGKRDEMLKKVQAKLGKTKTEFDAIISRL
ncbi:CsbD family protein [Flavobacterium suncheonense]|uniref:General stress protein CsbD n=1 Tax=Flavobacterium suncheonense GH29-5 = DSM 17707 TaxID=1121899 RepID=A0A0A2MHV2_9FLAO|nr:general stress protein CsbD [Flavobacterium suncheonense]KGO87900.1 general stress protein CsbD [Flavobacterium suncheonense GH29-5 = DSM 17707]